MLLSRSKTKKYIASGRTDKAIKDFIAETAGTADGYMHKQAMLLSAQWEGNEKASRLGLISP